MNLLAVSLLGGLCWSPAILVRPQGQDGPFAVREVAAAAGTARQLVSADRRAVPCLDALRLLSTAMNWTLRIDSKPLESELRLYAVDLDFVDQDPRVMGQLIAVAAGADAIFDDGDPAVGLRPTLHVTRKPDGTTESGRQRLRALATQWYRSLLADELRSEPVVAAAASQVRMHLGHLLVESGDLEAALPFFATVAGDRMGSLVPESLLRLAQTHLDLGAAPQPAAAARKHYAEAEAWARRVLEQHPGAPQGGGATVALGRALIGQAANAEAERVARELLDRCRIELASRVMRLLDTVELLDVWLLVGEAQFRLEWPTRVFESMLTLRESPHFGDMEPRQLRDYHFLLGYGAAGSGKAAVAAQALEWFLIHAEHDPRRGLAHLLLAEAYDALGRLVEARAAAVAVRDRFMGQLEPRWRTRALRLWARTALALGDKETAFQELEVLLQREEDPELVLFLVDELIADRQWQRAIAVARRLATRDGPLGDQARFRTVEALYQQAVASRNVAEFPAQARQIAPRITTRELRSRCAELIGDAYTALGQLEAAADAYRGILR